MIDMELYQRAFDALPLRTREIFWLHRARDLSYPEIAAQLGIAVEDVQEELANALVGIDRALVEYERQTVRASWAYRRWCLWWRIRHWRSWFLAPVDHANDAEHYAYVSKCMPRLTFTILVWSVAQKQTREDIARLTGLSLAAVDRHRLRAIGHIADAMRLQPDDWGTRRGIDQFLDSWPLEFVHQPPSVRKAS
jgi:hypothetical protein